MSASKIVFIDHKTAKGHTQTNNIITIKEKKDVGFFFTELVELNVTKLVSCFT